VEAIHLAFAPDGDISRADWHDADNALPYDQIAAPLKPWLLAPAPVRTMIERLGREARPLTDPENTKGIIVGIQTSADHIYHLKRLAKNRYAYTPRQSGKKLAPVEVEIEDAIMKPLVSGAEAKRFIEPHTDTFLLFPYRVDAEGAKLFTQEEMARHFPKAWKYLKGFEAELRAREGKKFDDDKWYRMGRTQNLDKQELPKLLVAQLVPQLRLSFDERGRFYVNNVRVNGILPRGDNGWFLLGVLNAPVSNAIFKWLGKPKDNGYYEANKQFIAPLPIPKASRAERVALSALAKGMQQRKTNQVDLRARLAERLGATARMKWPLEKLLPDVRSVAAIEAEAPAAIRPADRKKWVDDQRAADEEAALARIDSAVRLDSEVLVALADGKLAFLIDEAEVARVFVGQAESALVEAQWRAVALDFLPSGKGDAKRLIDRLRSVAVSAEPAVAEQIVAIGAKLHQLSDVIRDDEAQLHELTCQMFNLSDEERALVENSMTKA
jgi:hypothetical protein